MFKFSIITAVKNRCDSIERTIESIKKQTYKNVECVFIDGASTDGTFEVIKSMMGGNDFKLSEPDAGIYDALNKGLAHASGDIIGLLHSGDLYVDNKVLERVCQEFISSDVDIVYGDAIFFHPDHPKKITRRYRSGELSKYRLSLGKMPAHTAMFIRRNIYQKFGGFNINYKIAGDYDFLCRLLSLSNEKISYKYIPEVVVKMSLGGVSTRLENIILINKEILRACLSNQINTNYLKIFSRYPSKMTEKIFK